MKKLSVLLCLLLLIGCQANRSAQMRAEKMEEMRIAFKHQQDMCENLGKDASLDILRDKVGILRVENTTFEMLTNQAKPTDEEKVAIQKWVSKRDYCIKEQEALYKRFKYPTYWMIISKVFDDRVLFLITDLYSGSLTYGDFNRRRKELASEGRAKLSEMQRMDRQHAEQMAIEERKAKAQKSAADAAWFDAIWGNPVPVYVPPLIR